MILNFDRRRIYIFGAVGVFLIFIIAFYHAPNYVPTEVSRMKTSVSTWLKGTEPSLEDELYKDSPHFSVPKKPTEETTKSQSEHKTVQESIEYAETFPQPGFGLPLEEAVASSSVQVTSPAATVAATSAAAKLPTVNDFVNVLPPVEAISNAALATNAEYAMSLPELAQSATHSAAAVVQTTLATHVKSGSSAASSEAAVHEHAAFDDEKWYLEGDDKQR